MPGRSTASPAGPGPRRPGPATTGNEDVRLRRDVGIEDFSDAHRPLYEVKANLFKGVSHPVRVRILEVLAASPDDVPVADLIADTGLEASHVSQHLSVLRRHNLVVAERRASQVFYRLAFPEVADLLAVSRSLLVKILERTHDQLTSTVNSAALAAPPSPEHTPNPTHPTTPTQSPR